MNSASKISDHPPASLIKQLAAMLYDSLLIFSVLFLATAIALIFTQGEAIVSSPAFNLYLTIVVFSFYAWFWSRSGQTLGMRVWKIKIVSEFGGNPSWPVSYLRLVFALISMACIGLGYWWRLFKPYTWHDHLSQTMIIDISKSTTQHAEPGPDPV
ncbi:MAG: RDD family protein, partial [Pseudomonadota bacterium]